MKISNSKKEIARIISENGGWCDCVEFYVSTCNGVVIGSKSKPRYTSKYGWVAAGGFIDDRIENASNLKNWHQTILSRAEYFHLYPVPDADGWIEWCGGECPVGAGVSVEVKRRSELGSCLEDEPESVNWKKYDTAGDIIAYRLHKPVEATESRVPLGKTMSVCAICGSERCDKASDALAMCNAESQPHAKFCESVMRSIPEPSYKPTIEQLMQTYTDRAHSVQLASENLATCTKQANEAMEALSVACNAAGFDISPITAKQEPELVVNDWRDLRVGDLILCVGDEWNDDFKYKEAVVKHMYGNRIRAGIGEELDWGGNFKFIRRP